MTVISELFAVFTASKYDFKVTMFLIHGLNLACSYPRPLIVIGILPSADEHGGIRRTAAVYYPFGFT